MNHEYSRGPEIDLYQPIPVDVPSVDGWKTVPVRENGEPLVAVGSFSGNAFDRLFSSSIYFGEREDSPYPNNEERLEGSLITTFVREDAAKQLLRAEEQLPQGYHLVVLDTYRTLEVQQSLFDQYYSGLKERHPDWTEDELSQETQKYVSLPSKDPTKPSPHNTGGSIDLAIYHLPSEIDKQVVEINSQIEKLGGDENNWPEVYELEMERISLISHNAELLEFGSEFDHGGQESALNYFEKLAEQRELTEPERLAMMNRRLLYNVMIQVGFEPYADEWWHYNSPKSQMGAATAGADRAEYGAAKLSEENLRHEEIRKKHLVGTEYLSRAGRLRVGVTALAVASRSARKFGNIRTTSLPKAAIISPPEEKAA